jgi:hypothetical protein
MIVKCLLVFYGVGEISHLACSPASSLFLLPTVETVPEEEDSGHQGYQEKASTKLCAVPVDSLSGRFMQLLERCYTCAAVMGDYLEVKYSNFPLFSYVCVCVCVCVLL